MKITDLIKSLAMGAFVGCFIVLLVAVLSSFAYGPENVSFSGTDIINAFFDRRSREGGDRYDACVIGLKYEDRSILYDRIEKRVDIMLRDGLVDETRRLSGEGVFEKNATAAQAIGYKELFGFLRGEETLQEASECLKTATRRYAKRQMTWFLAKDYVQWIEADGKTFEDIVNNALELFKNK